MSSLWDSVHFSAVSGWADCTWSQTFTFPVLFSCLPLPVYDLNLLTSLKTSVSLHESVGLGCYWVDYSELWKRKCTSLWHLLTLVTFPFTLLCNFAIQCLLREYHSFPFLSSKYKFLNCIVCMHVSHRAQCSFVCVCRTAVPQWRLLCQATPHKPVEILSTLGSSVLGTHTVWEAHTVSLTSGVHALEAQADSEMLPKLMWRLVDGLQC